MFLDTGGLLISILFILFFILFIYSIKRSKRIKPFISDIRDLKKFIQLKPKGVYELIFFRQSGNVHYQKMFEGNLQDVISEVSSTFTRAGVRQVSIRNDKFNSYIISRLYHDHRGRREGKKVGWASLKFIRETDINNKKQEVQHDAKGSEPKISIGLIGLVCDCGANPQIEYENRFEEAFCNECGQEITLNEKQLSEIDNQINDAKNAIARDASEGILKSSYTLDLNKKIKD